MSEIEHAHPTSEVPVGRIVLAAGGLVVCLVAAGLGSWALFKAYLGAQPVPAPSASPAPTAAVEPRLQVAPAHDLAVLRAEEERILHSRGWVDRPAGIARIPIEQAMALLAKRSQAPTPPTGGARPRP